MEGAHHGVSTFTPHSTTGHVLCCLCGVGIPPNPANMCVNCMRTQVDITSGIQKQVTVLWCKACARYLQPPKHWLAAEPESRELLTYCIKRVRGLSKVRLVDAAFVWTEPHSMRLKAKLTVQGEALNGALLQQSFVVEYILERHMCPTCARSAANPNTWTACVQLRQHVGHKRTFFFLEQLILKHGADSQCVSVKEVHGGVDFYFGSRSHASKFLDFCSGVVPVRHRADKQLVSHNEHTSTYNYKFTFSAEIAPLCKDDLVFLPPKLSAALGHLGPLVLVTRVGSALTLTDPRTLRSANLDATAYWRYDLRPLATSKALTEFVVLDLETAAFGPQASARGARDGGASVRGTDWDRASAATGTPYAVSSGRFVLGEATVARAADLGANDAQTTVRTHLGKALRPGNSALGYDLGAVVISSADWDAAVARGWTPPDALLVRRCYAAGRRRRRARGRARRAWKIRRLAMEQEEEAAGGGRGRRDPGARDAEDMERFLEELEEDDDMRARVALYRDAQVDGAPGGLDADDEGSLSDGDEAPDVPLAELLDDLAAFNLGGEEEEGEGEEEEEEEGGAGEMMRD